MRGDDQKEAEEFAVFFERNMSALRGYLINAGSGETTADDIVQDTFLATRLYWQTIRSLDKPEAYLYKVATRCLYKERRRSVRCPGDSGQLPS
ncbi:RNA polymerase sigma factor [Actinomadura litoris]|uniref:RNA polymerase sigma-70 region 2 domain-containing protein n=1 Tax=Actinomadura litoris TaxID=2678616 RepID=A0A7K1LBA8_9ACTN|nr:hypothetical protein [Actinomadura litoris]